MKRFYIQCTSNYAYDYILWWKPDSKGYTHNLAEAGLYTEEEARSICGLRGEEVAWAKEDVLKHTDVAVSIEKLRQSEVKAYFKPTQKQIKKARKDKKPEAANCVSCGKFVSMIDRDPYQLPSCEFCL